MSKYGTCSTCAHWGIEVRGSGACRRYPPRDDKAAKTRWPYTMAGEWCGEHKERDDG